MIAVTGIDVLVIGSAEMDNLVKALRSDPRVARVCRVELLSEAGRLLDDDHIDGIVLATTTEQSNETYAGTLYTRLTEVPVVLYENRYPGDIGGPRALASQSFDLQVCALAAPLDPEITGRGIVDVLTTQGAHVAPPPPSTSALAVDPAEPLTFISYSRQDGEQVRALRRRLGSDGIRCWFDEECIRPGQDWDLEVRRAVSRCKFMLVCLSAKSASTPGYVHRELRMALEKASDQPEGSVFIIPVRLDDCPLPESLRRWHAVDLHGPSGYAGLLHTLREGW